MWIPDYRPLVYLPPGKGEQLYQGHPDTWDTEDTQIPGTRQGFLDTRTPQSLNKCNPVHPATWGPVHPDTWGPVHPDTWAPGHPDTFAPGHPDTWAPVNPDTYAPGHPDTWGPGHPDTWDPGHQRIWKSGHLGNRISSMNSFL